MSENSLIKSYTPGTLTSSVYPDNIIRKARIFEAGAQLAAIIETSGTYYTDARYRLHVYDQATTTWTVSGAVMSGDGGKSDLEYATVACIASGELVLTCWLGDSFVQHIELYTVDADQWDILVVPTDGGYDTKTMVVVSHSGSIASGYSKQLVCYSTDNTEGTSVSISKYNIPDYSDLTDGYWEDCTPSDMVTLSGNLLIYGGGYTPIPLAKLSVGSSNHDVFIVTVDPSWTPGDDGDNIHVLRYVTGNTWEDIGCTNTGGVAMLAEDDYAYIFREIRGNLIFGTTRGVGGNASIITKFVSANPIDYFTMWEDTGLDSSGHLWEWGAAETFGASSAVYMVEGYGTGGENSTHITEYSTLGGSTSGGACEITSAESGDVYNIGGISAESTLTIVFTLWDNEGYVGTSE